MENREAWLRYRTSIGYNSLPEFVYRNPSIELKSSSYTNNHRPIRALSADHDQTISQDNIPMKYVSINDHYNHQPFVPSSKDNYSTMKSTIATNSLPNINSISSFDPLFRMLEESSFVPSHINKNTNTNTSIPVYTNILSKAKQQKKIFDTWESYEY